MPRCDALDWMKAVGISLIVYGHVAHATTVPWTPPLYVKQFGVAFFLFATGVTLARERRRPIEVVVSRLFPVYLFGVATAIAISGIGLAFGGGLQTSNYLPFMAGANVVFDNFPANPTTWYLGTYIHALLLWACWLSRRQLGVGAVVLALAIEVPVRAALIAWAGPYVAYMAITNWLAVFAAGLAWGARAVDAAPGRAPLHLAVLVSGLAASAVAVGAFDPIPNFPFMTIPGGSLAGLAAVSVAASALYLWTTVVTFKAATGVRAPAAVRFLARNSLIIVLLHMPVFMALNPVLAGIGWPYWARVVTELVICLPVIAWLSEVLTGAVRPKVLAVRVMDTVMTAVAFRRLGRHQASLQETR